MCSVPVTFGGGSWIENAGASGRVPAAKWPRDSHSRYQNASMPAGSKLFASASVALGAAFDEPAGGVAAVMFASL